ncbi:lipoate--protein ligase family protein [Lactobacillus sp. LC28-10]|uniref:Lipoate--protein ligase family protein n=1 Tax=Secundilactobacillus angelensis TaxID=2722706 RepID=A0ABX1L056_9LACO|nr:lipoate--protein ligase family protein [Secundilactobacillus angelensis]MCH5463070.1 lipoate--protein ligase family protein [Secundilactobacillus angelensis]NLR18877.1 lipoate--protein ligase family protein [Secundilactobacillus angelensis]
MKRQPLFSSLQVIDTPLTRDNQLAAFGMTNALLDLCGSTNRALLHFWTLPPTLILGLKDRHLPELEAALATVTDNGYAHFIRNSGGLAVVSDGGVLNVSLFIPQTASRHLSVDNGYELMKQLLQQTFPNLTIESYEITHSYCPGDYDLSFNGKKFAGISQRRSTNALVVMAYISILGDQTFRGTLVRDFYDAGLAGHQNELGFPDVWPDTMINVADAMQQPLTITEVKSAILASYQQQDVQLDLTTLMSSTQSPEFQEIYNKELAKMQKRQLGI